jgi:hypothetical protein
MKVAGRYRDGAKADREKIERRNWQQVAFTELRCDLFFCVVTEKYYGEIRC